jgi:PXPV repeat (3 copies)
MMKKAILAGAAVLIFSSSAALAQAVYVTPGYAEPAYVAPAPVYVAPAPVYVAPATTVIVHRPIVRPAPVVTAAAPVYDYAPGEVVLHSRW